MLIRVSLQYQLWILIDIESNKKAHRMVGFFLDDMPVLKLDTHPGSEAIGTAIILRPIIIGIMSPE